MLHKVIGHAAERGGLYLDGNCIAGMSPGPVAAPMLEEDFLPGEKGGLRMKKRAVVFAVTLGLSVFALGSGPAAANESANAAIDCAGLGPPGQAAQTLGAAGSDRFQTPPELAAGLGQESVGATIETFCLPPAP